MADFNAQLQTADAIREVRARGCTTAGVAELIVEYHGALHVLSNLDKTQELGETLAKDPESPRGAKMRSILADVAAKEVKAEPAPVVDLTERAVQHVMKAGYSEEAARQIVAEHGADTVLEGEEIAAKEKEEAVQWLVTEHKYSEPTAREIVEKEGTEAVLAEKKHRTKQTSESAGSPSAPAASTGTEAGSASNAAADSSAPTAAAGTSAVPDPGAAEKSSDSPQTAQG